MVLHQNAPIILGHRGLCAFAPENTLPSFLQAAKTGLKWVEFDVQLSKDGKLVVFHDESLDRTTNGHGPLANKTLAELQALDAGSWFGIEFTGTKIPSLAELLPFLDEHHLQANIEIKANPEQAIATAEALIPFLTGWSRGKPYPWVSSFQHAALEHCREYLPQLPIGYLMEKIDWNLVSTLEPSPFISINCSVRHNTTDDYQRLIAQGFQVMLYTVNDPFEAEAFLESGIAGIFSDGFDD